MSRIALKLLNGLYGWIIGIAITTAVVYASYSIWDNYQVYQAAEDVQNEIRKLKPVENSSEGGQDFSELLEVNSDVVGWITVDGTNIDYPIVQGDTNLTYMDKDIYGEFSLAGSIFLDNRNNSGFTDNYSLVYGHNMDEHLMFGDLALFKDREFFKDNSTATLILPEEYREYKVAAILQVPAGSEEIFNPDKWKDSLSGLGEYLEENSIWYHISLIEKLIKEPEKVSIVSLVTCSDGSTNDRTVLILIREEEEEEPPTEEETTEVETTDVETTVEDITEVETTIEETTIEDTTEADSTVEETTIEDTTEAETIIEETTIDETTIEDTTEAEPTADEGGSSITDESDGVETIVETTDDSGTRDTTEDDIGEETVPTETTGDDIGGDDSTPTGDNQNPKLWLYILIADIVFIILFEATDKRLRKRRDRFS